MSLPTGKKAPLKKEKTLEERILILEEKVAEIENKLETLPNKHSSK